MRIPIKNIAAGILSAAIILGAGTSVNAAEPAQTNAVTIEDVLIKGNNVVVTTNGSIATDDGYYHLYAQDPAMTGVQGVEVAKAKVSDLATFTLELGNNTSKSNLYKKFTVVGTAGGTLTDLSNDKWITNPEALAKHTQKRSDNGKKGIIPDAEQLNNISKLKDLGVKQITYNVDVGRLLSGTGVDYAYNGQTYSFSSNVVGEYDSIVPKMNKAGIQVTLIILCGPTSGDLIHPLSRGVDANYYMFNTTDTTSLCTLEAVASFLGERYSGTGHGTVDNWIIGNEVNARTEWNYMDPAVGLAGFVKSYADEFRIFYNGIKSQNANARIYICTDQEWKSDNAAKHYGGQEFLTAFNTKVKAEGNIDWSLASHPYNYPLYEPNGLISKPQVTHSKDTKYITMANVDVLTDFMCQKDYLNPSDKVRSISLTEVGYTSSKKVGSNEALQAANVVFAIVQSEANRHIDGIIINRQRSHEDENEQDLDFGLEKWNGSSKQAYEWYKTAMKKKTVSAASKVLGKSIIDTIVKR